LIASAAMPFVLWLLDLRPDAVLFVLLTIVLWLRHRENIARLLDGTEGKIGKGAASSQEPAQ
jgi:glycerol-3-phosphate acyltransferase PlsY